MLQSCSLRTHLLPGEELRFDVPAFDGTMAETRWRPRVHARLRPAVPYEGSGPQNRACCANRLRSAIHCGLTQEAQSGHMHLS